jgi:threonine/homoserine/homoserine lactone efflux protein
MGSRRGITLPMLPVDPNLLAGYLLACVVLVLTPGPDMAFVLGQTLSGGARRGWAATCGVFTGAAVHILAAAAGVAALVAAHPALFTALRVAGALYLLWLGFHAIRAALRGEGGLGDGGTPSVSLAAAYRQGFLTNLLNPKVGLFFLAFVPLFVDPARSPAWVQMLILGPLLPAISIPFFGVLIAGASRIADRLRASSAGRWLDGAAGTLFLGLGIRLLAGAPR